MKEKRLLRHLKKVFFQCVKMFYIKIRLKNKLKNKLKKKIKKRKDALEKFSKELFELETGNLDKDVFYEYFGYKMPSEMASKLVKSNKEDNINLVALIQENLSKLIEGYHNTPDENVMKEELRKIKHTVERILDFNEEYKKGQGLKILTPKQMLSRLPISLAQLKAENNSQKLKK